MWVIINFTLSSFWILFMLLRVLSCYLELGLITSSFVGIWVTFTLVSLVLLLWLLRHGPTECLASSMKAVFSSWWKFMNLNRMGATRVFRLTDSIHASASLAGFHHAHSYLSVLQKVTSTSGRFLSFIIFLHPQFLQNFVLNLQETSDFLNSDFCILY